MIDPITGMAVAGAVGQIGKGLSGLFGKKKNKNNPADASKPYLDQVPGATKPYYQPYIDEGRNASGNVNREYGRMTDNPQDVYDQMGKGYKESPGYQTRLQAGLQAAQNASAAGGMLGTPQYQQQSAQIANDMSSKDYEDYMNHMMDIYGQGVQGQQGTANQGYDASKGYADILGNNLNDQATNAYEGQKNTNEYNNQRKNQGWGDMFSGLGGLSGLFGGSQGGGGDFGKSAGKSMQGINWGSFFGGGR